MGGEARNDATTQRRNGEGRGLWFSLSFPRSTVGTYLLRRFAPVFLAFSIAAYVSCGEWSSGPEQPDSNDDDVSDDDTTAADDDTTAGDDDTTAADDDTTAGDDDTVTGDDDTSGPADCSPGPGTGEADECEFLKSLFYGTVSSSVLTVVDDHPDWFEEGGGTWYVLQTESYMDSVVALVNTYNLCAIRDPNAGDEIAVKHDNAFAESFDILTWDGYVRYGEGIYNATCAPAWF
jgi:hypothetical protein